MTNISQLYTQRAIAELSSTMRKSRPTLMKSFGSIEHSYKDDKTIVTQMDAHIETLLTNTLLKIDKDIGIIGEELGAQGDDKVYWLLDPIDGTEQFVRGLNGCVNMACLIYEDEPVVSIIYDFVNDGLYIAEKNKGATKNAKSVHVSKRPLNRAWVDFSFRRNQPEVIPALTKLMQSCSIVRLRNSLLVTCGAIDGLVAIDGKGGLWDYAPRLLMIQEAGGKIANIGSESYSIHNTSFIASNPVIFAELQQILTDYI